MKTQHKSKTIALPFVLKASADGTYPTEIEIAKTGYWETPWHGDFDLTENDFDQAVANFQAGKYRVNGTEPLAGTLDHLGGESPAAFRIVDVYRDGDRLMARVTWTALGKEKLDRDEYRYVSFEFCTRAQPFPNPENVNEMFVNVVTGATLTNDPLFKKLKPVMASAKSGQHNQEGEHMDLEAIRAKKLEDLSDEEKAFLEDNKDELTDEERTAFGITSDEAETDEEKAEREVAEKKAADEKAAAEKEAAEAEALKASVKGMTKEQKAEFMKLQASVKSMEAEVEAGRTARLELEKSKLRASVQTHVARGAIKSDQIDAGVELLLASSEKDRAKLTAFLEALPTNELLKAEAGHGGEGEPKVEVTKEETEVAESFGNSAEEIAAYKAKQAKKESN